MTVVEVSGLDRPGLLFDLTAALSRLDLNIGSAHIATFGEKAADVFYVTDLNGDKITASGQQELIRQSLLGVFDQSAEDAAPKAARR
jgi:[protein-PII] uridylyltransferase